MPDLLILNANLDRARLANEFASSGRLQARDVLTQESAHALQDLLAHGTPWGLAWQAGATSQAQLVRADALKAMPATERQAIVSRAATDPDYGFAYHSYPLVTAYLERWQPGSPHERLLEELNGPQMLALMKEVSGFGDIIKMDGQATLYDAGNFLRPHNDEESARGRRVAYVLNLTLGEWQPQWGGYLNFYDADWDIETAFRPRFNSLNLFRVPQWHSVGEVSTAAPRARYAVTGWARNL
jgi:Rps23 Pro-64 3,4-dihydroxylase Tpa1-like proline 4-hydroxylase